ncbi:MAG: hypothetical protein QM811_01725 [Pirellulales bacterium]
MARDEQDRENLLRDARAYVDRAEFRHVTSNVELFVGFRAAGGMSVYLDQDPVYHWNSRGELRRAFVAGRLFKAEFGRLIALERVRDAERSVLRSQPLSDDEQQTFLIELANSLETLKRELASETYACVGEITSDAAAHTVEHRIKERLADHASLLRVATAPNVN